MSFWGANMDACFRYLDEMDIHNYGSMSPGEFASYVDKLTGYKSDHTQEPDDWAKEVLPYLREISQHSIPQKGMESNKEQNCI